MAADILMFMVFYEKFLKNCGRIFATDEVSCRHMQSKPAFSDAKNATGYCQKSASTVLTLHAHYSCNSYSLSGKRTRCYRLRQKTWTYAGDKIQQMAICFANTCQTLAILQLHKFRSPTPLWRDDLRVVRKASPFEKFFGRHGGRPSRKESIAGFQACFVFWQASPSSSEVSQASKPASSFGKPPPRRVKYRRLPSLLRLSASLPLVE